NTAGLGTMTGLVYFMPTCLDCDDPSPRSLIRHAAIPVGIAGLLAGATMAILAGPIASVVAPSLADEAATMLRLMAVAVPAWALTVSFLGATRGLGSMTPTVAVNQVFKPIGQLGGVAMLLLLSGEPSLVALGIAWGWPIVAAAGLAFVAVWRSGGLTGGSDRPVSSGDFWRYTRPRAVATGLQIALERIDVIFVSALAGEAAAGIYGAITRFITAGNFLIHAIGQATSPGLRRAISSEGFVTAQRLLHQATGWMVLIAWPYLLLVAMEAGGLVTLLSPELAGSTFSESSLFSESSVALSILAVALLTHAATGPIDLALLMLGRSRASLAIAAVALAADVAIAIALIPRFGLIGAALGWAAAVLIQNISAAVLVERLGGLRPFGRAAMVAAIGALIAVVPVSLSTPAGTTGLAYTAVASAAIYGLWIAIFTDRIELKPLLPAHLRR
ncbi:MAG: polysaccharide biosynthesis C-terminal domain-containing protein, partial [Acidimicrobiales bacterium]